MGMISCIKLQVRGGTLLLRVWDLRSLAKYTDKVIHLTNLDFFPGVAVEL